MSKFSFIHNALESRHESNLLRKLRTINSFSGVEIEVEGKSMLNFCSNDYLGLSGHPLLKQRASEFLAKYGAGSTASRLVCGNYDCFDIVEKRVAELTEKEGALVFNSGFQANVSLIPTLADKNTLILSDSLNHNSIIQGAILSRCHVKRFRHNDMDDLEKLLRENRGKGISRKLIVTETVFSMDGDVSNVDVLLQLAEKYDALLIVDEAHAIGTMGKKGMGLSCGKNVDIIMGTFSKAGGSSGAYVACSKEIRDYLINFCYGFIYTTALSPPVIGAIDAALELIPEMENERKDILNMSDYLRSVLRDIGYDTGNSSTQIVPVIIGEEQEALRLSAWLENNGIFAITFRPPTVKPGESRIRLALSSLHTMDHVKRLIDLMKEWKGKG